MIAFVGAAILAFGAALFWRGVRVGTLRGMASGALVIDGWFRRSTLHANDIIRAETVRRDNAVGRAGLTLGLVMRDGRRRVWDIWWTPVSRTGRGSAPSVVDAINVWLGAYKDGGKVV